MRINQFNFCFSNKEAVNFITEKIRLIKLDFNLIFE